MIIKIDLKNHLKAHIIFNLMKNFYMQDIKYEMIEINNIIIMS